MTKSLYSADARTKRRNAAERRFKAYGAAAIGIAMVALVILLTSVVTQGIGAFRQTYITVDVPLPEAKLDKSGTRDMAVMSKVTTIGYAPLLRDGLVNAIAEAGIQTDLSEKEIGDLISKEAAATVRNRVLAHPDLIGQPERFSLLADGRIDGYFKGRVTMASAALDQNTSPEKLDLADKLRDAGIMQIKFNWAFLTAPDASDQRPEAAGLGVAILGSLYMMIVVLVLALPIGVAASIYLEEFAPKNRWTDVIEVNIANLAAVPSIVYGILGLAIFINFMQFNQSSPLVGGMVLALMTLPTIIISTRAALKAVPPSIRDAALGVGASKMQSVFHHVLPLAAPGILTGTIIGLAQALGETAPLLLIGMVAFVRDYPEAYSSATGLFGDPSTALPVQIYNWTQRADPAFVERAQGAIITLLVFLLIMNTVAIVLRRRFERRW
ncbi:phosphate ABC transporter membrane protein 2, PhoT family [Loktanella atrilutea]|uniref:Phosphate transport system permease protein PstA n=1 Tax=Loktanella atrilutea TaxID=366533 RepID=A0A1M4UEU9_LOKAT|nr:phosphate ABC transporter permease PstA [Loktanella atrilutea]SHE55255.1 phosphate ABC transporter membrane protein 2, PhoT family [Loktanella atrilutea]